MNLKHFLANVTSQDLILTANRRLAVYLQKNYDQSQVGLGMIAWPNLQLFSLSNWIEQIWEIFCCDSRRLLTEFQELLIWEEILNESNVGEHFLNIPATARLAKDSWLILNNWLLKLNDIEGFLHHDVQIFIGWSKEFQKKCWEKNCISRSEVLPDLIAKLKKFPASFQLPTKIFFVGFDDISPAINQLQSILSGTTSINNIQFSNEQDGAIVRTSFPDQETELYEMAGWAYQKLTMKSKATIGCVIPNLTEKRNQVVRIFNEVFFSKGLHKQYSYAPFNISAAENLRHFSIIQIALKILSLNQNEINLEDVSCLLRTPFLAGSESELNSRANLDVRLRAFGEKKIFFERLITSNLLSDCPILLASLKKLRPDINHLVEKYSLEDWTKIFVEQLAAVGWPGERSLNSTEFQLLERFKKLLSEYTALSKFLPQVSFAHALSLLQQLISATLFQPKSADLPIQILGMLEAGGINFDYLWVAGLDNETWPPPSSPNPFIPMEIQKKYQMPHATSERELQFSLGVTNRFIKNAMEIIFSHAEYEGDRPLNPSPLISSFPRMSLNLLPYVSIGKMIYATRKIESFIDNFGPKVESELAMGGSWIFQAQAACPFQAFAKFRLNAKPLEDTQMGLAFHERGSLVHEILANLWSEICSHELLCSFTQKELNDLVAKAIDISLIKIREKKPFTLNTALISIEKRRLQKLILKWLEIEKTRQPFEVISCEQKQTILVNQLAVHVQIDRIDKLMDGSHLIIDYKTGRPSILDWFSERPNEPQLPLYAIASDQIINGILFAQVRADEMTFKGLTAHHDIVPGALTLDRLKGVDFVTLKALIDYWQTILYQLADDFCQGKADVAPKDATTCQYCPLEQLCRVNASSRKIK